MSGVPVALIGDRFVSLAPRRWLDLATGDAAAVSVRAIEGPVPRRLQRCQEKLTAPEAIASRLIDCGLVGSTRWFEARALGTRPAAPTAETATQVQKAVRRLVTTARAPSASVIRVLRLTHLPKDSLRPFAQAAGRELRTLGFVTVRAGLVLPWAVGRELVGRHIVVIGLAGDDREHLAKWIRRLGAASRRGHVVVEVGSEPGDWGFLAPASTLHVRERATSDGPYAVVPFASDDERPSFAGAIPGARLVRAASYLQRGRRAAAERWLRAGLESARRHADPAMEAKAGSRLVEHLAHRGAWNEARDLAVTLAARVQDWPARVMMSAAAARTLVVTGDLQSADTMLAGVLAEARVRHEDVSPLVRVRLAEVRFWQGRFEEAAALLPCRASSAQVDPDSDAEGDALIYRGLLAWAMGDRAELAAVVGSVGTSWLSVLLESVSGQHLAAADSARTLLKHPPRDAMRSRRALSQAIAAEVLLAAGCVADARRALGQRSTRRSRDARLDVALLDWIRGRAGMDGEAGLAAERFIHRSGARGVTRWGSGRARMHLHHAMPALLQIIHDAEDEIGALTGGCAWVRSHAEAEAVGIVSAVDRRLVAAEGLRAADLGASEWREVLDDERGRTIGEGSHVVVSMPIRHAGATIGFVAARGRAEAAATLTEAVLALASLCGSALRVRLDALVMATASQSLAPEILGRSPAMAAIREATARAAATAFPVLIEGASGTGKELVARALHRLSPRRDRRFSAINCAALTDDLVEAELFGYARGAFTGAVAARAGLFEEAHLGTLFLDEVSELSARAQAKLLRAVQEREIRRLGENADRPVDVRIVAATNRSLGDSVGQGAFREDLMFRLAVVRIRLPPLRDRLEDVPLLAQVFWKHVTTDTGKRAVLGADAMAALCRHAWPGNVRELQNTMAALVVLAPARGRIGARHVDQVLATAAGAQEPVTPLGPARLAFERRMVAAALARHGGRRAGAARELGLTRQGLTKAIRRLGLEVA